MTEFMTLFVKSKKPTTPGRIDKLILMLNAPRDCEDRVRAALGREQVDPVESTTVKATDVEAMTPSVKPWATVSSATTGERKTSSPIRQKNPTGS